MRVLTPAVVVALAVALGGVATQAQPVDPAPGERWWRDRALLPALELEPAVRQALERIHAEASAELERLAAEQAAAEEALARRIHDPAGTATAAIEPVLARVVLARVAVERRHARMLLELRAGLGPRAFEALQRLQAPAGPQALAGPQAARGQPPPSGHRGGPAGPELMPGGAVRPDGAQGPFGPGPPAGPVGPPPPRRVAPPPPRRVAPPLPPGSWWREPGRQQQLTLTPREVGDLEAAFAARREALHRSSAALEVAEAAMHRLLAPGPLDLEPAVAASSAVAAARGALDRQFLELQWAQWLVLGEEQRLRLTYDRPPP